MKQNFQKLTSKLRLVITIACVLSTSFAKAQDPQGPPEPVGTYCPVNTLPFTPQIGIGTLNKMIIGGPAGNDGSICWNCYNDSSGYGRARAFNMPDFSYQSGAAIPNFSSRITQDLQRSVMRWQVGVANCYNQISWQHGITLRTNGSVGIGTDETFGFKLAVNGGIACKNDVFLTQTDLAWPDYVFANSYNLIPLLELEKQIDSLGHLPQMPSAKEVEEKGLSLGAVTTTVVQKVEELTLYAIEQQKQIDALKKQNEELLKRLGCLTNEK